MKTSKSTNTTNTKELFARLEKVQKQEQEILQEIALSYSEDFRNAVANLEKAFDEIHPQYRGEVLKESGLSKVLKKIGGYLPNSSAQGKTRSGRISEDQKLAFLSEPRTIKDVETQFNCTNYQTPYQWVKALEKAGKVKDAGDGRYVAVKK